MNAVETAPSRPQRSGLAWAVAALAAVCAGGLAYVHFRAETPAEAPVIRSTILPPDNTEWDFTNGLGLPALSPDGRRIVFGARTSDGKNPLWVRSLDGVTAQPLAGTDRGSFPFWSPDSRFIGFFADGKLRKIDASGGPALTLADAPAGCGGSWNQGGVIVFAPRIAGGALLRVSSAGGTASPVSAECVLPWFLPDGRHFICTSVAGATRVVVGSLDGTASKVVVEQASTTAVYAQGHLLFLREGTFYGSSLRCAASRDHR